MVKGTMVVIEQVCKEGHKKIWSSQPRNGTMPQGNLLLAAGIFFSGCSPNKVLKCLRHCNIATFGYRTFNLLQRSYLIPAVFHVWKMEQDKIFQDLKKSGKKVVLGGDGRCDSPGHSAKYGSYTMMEIDRSRILDIQLVQCNEVSSSNAMELEGLKRCLRQK